MANINKYITAGFMFNWKAVPNIKDLADEFGIDLENVELIVNGLKTPNGTYSIDVYARVDGEKELTHVYDIENITEEQLAKNNGLANYYSILAQKVVKSDSTDWGRVYESILNTDDFDDNLDWDSLDDIILDDTDTKPNDNEFIDFG